MSTYEEKQCEYIPDFTVTPVTDCLVIIITRHQYEAARKATIFETQCAATGQSGSRTDLFSHEWEMAETKDIETCQSSASGLSSITKFLPKKPPLSALKKRRASDKRELLTSTTSTSTGSCTEDSSGSTTQSSSGAQKHTGAVHISVENNRDEVFLPMFGAVDGNDSERGIKMVEQSRNTYDASPVRYRTSGSTSPGEREQAASGDPWATTGSVAGFSTQV